MQVFLSGGTGYVGRALRVLTLGDGPGSVVLVFAEGSSGRRQEDFVVTGGARAVPCFLFDVITA